MFTQVLLGIVFIVLPLAFTFAVPLLQEYFSKDNAFSGVLDECETLFVEDARSAAVHSE
jgi:hypothetical protein